MLSFFLDYDVKVPQRNNGDAGIDFFIPNFSKKFILGCLSCNIQFISGEYASAEGDYKSTFVFSDEKSIYNGDSLTFVEDKNSNLKCAILRDGTQVTAKSKILVGGLKRVLVPSGVYAKIAIPEPLISYGLEVCLDGANKSSIATKLGLDVAAELIDKSYQGEIHISLTNTTADPVPLSFGQKIVQYVPYVYLNDTLNVSSNKTSSLEDFYKGIESERGTGGFGSTGK